MSVNVPDADEWTSFAVTAAHRAEVAVLDCDGVIVAVDDAWTDFARRNGSADPARCGPGASYLAVCDTADDDVAAAVAAAIRQAVAGALPVPVGVTVSCDSPDRSRWFVTLVSSRFGDDGQCQGACVVLVPVAGLPREAGAAGHGEARGEGHTGPLGPVDHAVAGPAAALPVEALTPLGEPTPDGWLAVDAGGRILAVNQRLETLSGYPATELVGRPVDGLLSPLGPAATTGPTVPVGRAGPGPPVDLLAGDAGAARLRRRDGSLLAVDVRWSHLTPGGQVLTIASVPDMTAARTGEELVRGRAAVLDLVPDAVITTDPATTQVLYVNDAACRLLGYSRAQLVAMRTPQLRPDLSDADRRALITDLITHPGVGARLTDIVLRSRDGQRIDCESHSAVITVDSGRPVLVNVIRDVRERQALIEGLRTSEASFRTAFEQAPVGVEIVRIRPDGTLEIVRANRALSHLLGEPVEALLGSSLAAFTPAQQPRHDASTAARLAAGEVGQLSELHLYRRRDGSQLWVEARACRVELPDVEGPLALVHLVDVTARETALARLSVSEASFRTAFDQAPVGALVARVEDDGRRWIVRANPALAHTLGEPVEALIGEDLSRFVDPLDADQAVAGWTDVAGGRSPEASGVWRFRARDGSRRWLDVRIVPVQLPDLPGSLVLAYLADVTQQQALERLAISNASFRTVFDRSPIAAVVVRLNAGRPRLVRANRAAARLFGDNVDALIAADSIEFTLPNDPDTGGGAALAMGDLAEYSTTRRYPRRDGSRFWAEVHAVPIRLPDLPGPLALVHLVDVTERRMAEVRRAHAAAVDQLVAQVVTAVLADQPLPATYQQVADGVAEVFCAENVTVVLPDPATQRFTVAGAHGPVATDPMRSDWLAAQDFLTWLTTQAGQGVIIPVAAPGLPAWAALLGSAAVTRFGASPADGGGVLVAARARGEEPFTTNEADLLTSLARQLTLAIRLGQTQSEQRRHAAERDAYLRQLEDLLRPLSDPADIQTIACRVLGEHLQASRVLYAELEDGPVAVIEHEYLDGVDSIIGRQPVDMDIEGVIQLCGESLIVDDASADARLAPAARQMLLNSDVAAGIVVPLVKSGRLIAVLSVHSVRLRQWTDLEVQLTRDTAERTWAAVERSLAEQASAAERLRRQAAERELVEQAAREQRERLEQEFITNAAHELRTPLTGILAAVDALEAGASDDADQRHRFLTHLRRESTRLARLSGSLLLLAQAQSLGPPSSQPFAVADLLDTVAADLQVADTVTVTVQADPCLTLQANPGLTEVIVSNLARNAARYTSAGHIRLSARTQDTAVVVEVGDTGPGMDDATLSRARDRFYRHSMSRDGDGFGLGLSIAVQAAAAMGATLDLRSTPGAGTCARVTFPAPDSQPPPHARAQHDAPDDTTTR